MEIMNFKVFEQRLESIDFDSKKIINTLNAHSYIVSKKDSYFRRALKDSDILIPDGSGIVLAARYLCKKSIKKVSGSDLHKFLLKITNNNHGKVFYLGSSQSNLEKIEIKTKHEFPNIKLESYSPPFKNEFSEEENNLIIDKINCFGPDILFIGMTAPKQEKWLYQNKDRLNFRVAASVGAVFNFYSGAIKRPNKFLRKLIGESLSRFIKEPRRLWKRSFISIPLFLIEIMKFKLKK